MKPSVIWTVCACDKWDLDYILRVMRRAAAEGVSGIELTTGAIDRFIRYRDFPELKKEADTSSLRAICAEAIRLRLRLCIWHHEVTGPTDLLGKLPELHAADGLINLESPLLYQFIGAKCREFFGGFPEIAELVLTLTETD